MINPWAFLLCDYACKVSHFSCYYQISNPLFSLLLYIIVKNTNSGSGPLPALIIMLSVKESSLPVYSIKEQHLKDNHTAEWEMENQTAKQLAF